MKLFALGLKHWVEIRKGRKAPEVKVSKYKMDLEVSVDTSLYRTPPSHHWIRQVCFKGGKYVTSIRKRRFSSLTSLKVPIHKVVEIPSIYHPLFLGG